MQLALSFAFKLIFASNLPSGAPGAAGLHTNCAAHKDFRLSAFGFRLQALGINIGADVWGESSIMTGVYEHW